MNNISFVKSKHVPTIDLKQQGIIFELLQKNTAITNPILLQKMGSNLAELCRNIMPDDSILNAKIVILAGSGTAGAQALSAAWHLQNFGAKIKCYLVGGETDLSKSTLQICKSLYYSKVFLRSIDDTDLEVLINDILKANLVIEGLLGIECTNDPPEPYPDLIGFVNQSRALIVSTETPTGLDPVSGKPYQHTVDANATISYGLPLFGITLHSAKKYVGEIYLSDISVPNQLYKGLDIYPPIMFDKSSLVKLV